jgi:hypothetical protein
MPAEKEQEDRRVTFEHPLPAQMMAIDGTWRRACMLKDVSDIGAKLQVETSIEGLTLNEFFLLLSSTGLAYRRCQLERVNGEELQVSFIRQKAKAKKILGPELEPEISKATEISRQLEMKVGQVLSEFRCPSGVPGKSAFGGFG